MAGGTITAPGFACDEPLDDLVDVGRPTAGSRASGRRRGPSRPASAPRTLHSRRNSASRTETFFWSLSQGAATFRSPAKTRTSMTGRPRRTAYSWSRQAAVIAPSSACGQSITSGRSGRSRSGATRGRRRAGRACRSPGRSRAGGRTRAASGRIAGQEGVFHERGCSDGAVIGRRTAVGSSRRDGRPAGTRRRSPDRSAEVRTDDGVDPARTMRSTSTFRSIVRPVPAPTSTLAVAHSPRSTSSVGDPAVRCSAPRTGGRGSPPTR